MADKRRRVERSREDATIERAGRWRCFSFLGCLFCVSRSFRFLNSQWLYVGAGKLEDSWCVCLSLSPACGRKSWMKLTSWSLD
ncbi:hypothetical protein CABS01_00390 [Colletotrichum abscissum]|uniref:uncharacterized protein n=1 Tax=Colletotrichum abscissum TaxID=1671311 RepID=UPI0027D5ECA1|nr:uncharacterized protein CABS01_00390 [Colletotrichum abscissum]KAK1525301.1 hypothetical protein CABS01_00390 [Colletotrichum abscissum]